jgi:hypothetical protein
MVRTFLKVYMELGSYFLFLQEQIKDIIIMHRVSSAIVAGDVSSIRGGRRRGHATQVHVNMYVNDDGTMTSRALG